MHYSDAIFELWRWRSGSWIEYVIGFLFSYWWRWERYYTESSRSPTLWEMNVQVTWMWGTLARHWENRSETSRWTREWELYTTPIYHKQEKNNTHYKGIIRTLTMPRWCIYADPEICVTISRNTRKNMKYRSLYRWWYEEFWLWYLNWYNEDQCNNIQGKIWL